MMRFINRPLVLLVMFFLCVAGVISLRVCVEETSYLSPDSHFYLRIAQNLVDGKGLISPRVYPFDSVTEEKALCLWPAGYPVLIAGVGYLSGNVFIASKAVNILFIGFCLALFYYFYRERGLLLGLIFCFYGVLEVYSYSWSEGVFLFALLVLWQLLLYHFKNNNSISIILGISFMLSFLFLVRYAGVIYLPFVFLIGCYYGRNNSFKKMWGLWSSLVLPILVVLSYFYYNYLNSGSMTGSDRVFPYMESLNEFSLGLIQGLVNELTVARNYYFSGYTDYLYIVLLLIQVMVTGRVFFQFKKEKLKWEWSLDSKILLVMSVFYLVSIVVLRKLSPFDHFNYRILAPCSFLFWIAVLLELTQYKSLWQKVRMPVVSFLLLSLIMNLPKEYLLSLL